MADIRNSKVVQLIKALKDYSAKVDVVDPYASVAEVEHEYNLKLRNEIGTNYDAILIAVGHSQYRQMTKIFLKEISKAEMLIFYIKGMLNKKDFDNYWKL